MTDQEYFEALKEGDRRAERDIYLGNKAKCIRHARVNFFWKQANGGTIRCSQEDAEELYNDASAIFIHNVFKNRINQLEIKISTYLIKAMQYSWFNKARAKKPVPVITPEAATDEELVERTRQKVRLAIGQLDEKCREMMTYRYVLGWEDYEDIAGATGKNNGDVVRNLISRCRKKFRERYLLVGNSSNVEKLDRS